MNESKKVSIFLVHSYDEQDEGFNKQVESLLSNAIYNKKVRLIDLPLPGENKKLRITKALNEADLVIPILSLDFFKFLVDEEIDETFQSFIENNEGKAAPIFFRPCDWSAYFKGINIIAADKVGSIPLSSIVDRDKVSGIITKSLDPVINNKLRSKLSLSVSSQEDELIEIKTQKPFNPKPDYLKNATPQTPEELEQPKPTKSEKRITFKLFLIIVAVGLCLLLAKYCCNTDPVGKIDTEQIQPIQPDNNAANSSNEGKPGEKEPKASDREKSSINTNSSGSPKTQLPSHNGIPIEIKPVTNETTVDISTVKPSSPSKGYNPEDKSEHSGPSSVTPPKEPPLSFDCPDKKVNYYAPCDDGDPCTTGEYITDKCGCDGGNVKVRKVTNNQINEIKDALEDFWKDKFSENEDKYKGINKLEFDCIIEKDGHVVSKLSNIKIKNQDKLMEKVKFLNYGPGCKSNPIKIDINPN
jgi:hypothetical protein